MAYRTAKRKGKKRRALALQIVDQITEVIEHRISVQFALSHQRLKFIANELRKAFSVSHESVVEVQGVSA
jgi:predicted Zn-dependent protease with MMP-like domain